MSSAAVAFLHDYSTWVQPMRPAVVRLEYVLSEYPKSWELDEEDSMPESNVHHTMIVYLESLLKAWAERSGRSLLIGSNLAIRWDESNPNVGVDPDVYVVPMPPEGEEVDSLCLWKPGHCAPWLAIEVVSPHYAKKDYEQAPQKYSACGVRELWIVDPRGVQRNDSKEGYRIEMWSRDESMVFRRVYAGSGPVFSEVLQAWIKASPLGRQLWVSNDREGAQRWLTETQEQRLAKEQQCLAKEQERLAREQERVAKEAALQKIAELQAEIERMKK